MAFSPEYRSNRIQRLLKKSLVSREIANMEERALLSNWVKVHRPYHSDIRVNTYTKGTAVTPQDITATDEYLTVDQTKEATVYVDQIDVIQNKYDTANQLTDRISYALKRDIDGAFLAQVVNTTLSMDDADLGGTSGVAITVTTSNIVKMFALAEAKMNQNNIEDTKPRYAVITPMVKAIVQQSLIFNGFRKADDGLDGMFLGNGFMGRYMNFNIYSSNNVLHTQVLTSTTDGTNTNTVTIGGVVFTLLTTLGTTAGNVALGANEAATLDNLASAINGSAGAGTTYIEVSAANRLTLNLQGVAALSDSVHTLTLTSQWPITCSETMAAGSWGTQYAQCLFGQMNSIDMVIQQDVTVQQNKVPDKTGYNYLIYDLYGIKMFTRDGANRNMKVKVVA